MEHLKIPGRMEHFRVRLPAALIAAIFAEAGHLSRTAGHRITPSALVRAVLSARFAHSPGRAALHTTSRGA